MDYRKEFERMMKSQREIALATLTDGRPNVRIVNFYYESECNTLYFSSFADNQKVVEVDKNPHIAFTTISANGEEHVRVQNGVARRCQVSIDTIKDKFLAKMPDYMMSIPEMLPALVLFEVTFDRADVVLDFEHMENITL